MGFVFFPALLVAFRGGGIAPAAELVVVLAALIGVGAGLAALVQWRLVGQAFAGWLGIAFVSFGILSLMIGDLPNIGLGYTSVASSLGRMLSVALVSCFLWQAARAPEVDAGLAPIRSLGRVAVVGVALLGALALIEARVLPPAWPMSSVVEEAADSITAALWLGLAAVFARHRHGGERLSWLTVSLLLLGSAGLVSDASPSSEAQLGAALLTACATALAAAASFGEASAVLRSRDHQELRLRSDLDDLRAELREERSALEDRLHDLRNAVTAVRAADRTIRRYAERLDKDHREALAEALSGELARLQLLIEPGRRAVPLDFEVADVLEGVVMAERSLGTSISLDLAGVWAHGDPAHVAQAVQNLLVNARRYAPGCHVAISASAATGRVEILVADDGPGIPEHERVRIFLRGVRGSTAAGTPGDGLGLHMAAQLLATCGGQIRLLDRPRPGACFLIELPAPRLPGGGELGRCDPTTRTRVVDVPAHIR